MTVVPVEGAVVTVGTVVTTVGGVVGAVVTGGGGTVVAAGTVVGVVGVVVPVGLGVVVPVVGCDPPPVPVPPLVPVPPVTLPAGAPLLPVPAGAAVPGPDAGGKVTEVVAVVSTVEGGGWVVTPKGPLTVAGVVGVDRATPGVPCFEPRLRA